MTRHHTTIPTPLDRTQRRVRAFTIIELIVAIGLTSLMLLLINQIFNSTQRSMNMGIARSDIIGNERGFGEQFEFDAEAMIGPDEDTDPSSTDPEDDGGFLVIVQYQVNTAWTNRGPQMKQQARSLLNPNPDPVRSDQLLFFRKRSDGTESVYPVTPGSTSTYMNTFRRDATYDDSEYYCDYLKVWYGHAAKALSTGFDDPIYADLGGYNGVWPNIEPRGNINGFAQDWILARQAMFLVDEGTDEATSVTPSSGPPPADGRWDFATTHIYADTALYNSSLNGYGTSTPFSGPIYTYQGLADIAAQPLGGISVQIPHHPSDPTASDKDTILRDLTNGSPNATDTYYFDHAINYLYLLERLRVNPQPQLDWSSNQYSAAAWQIAQMHPILFSNVSDFIVEFAADIDEDGEIDHTDVTGYDADNDPSTPTIDLHNIIKWYGHYYNDPTINLPNGERLISYDRVTDTAVTGPFDPGQPIVFALPGGAGPGAPAGIYRPYEKKPLIPTTTNPLPNADGIFTWRHDDENGKYTSGPAQSSFWPYLIRVRFRAHDRRGLIESGDAQHGVWLEHIIKVNRPPAVP